MKKKIIIASIMGAFALAPIITHAETVLYGSIRYGVEYGYNHGQPRQWQINELGQVKKLGKRGLDMVDQGSRFGIRGGEDLGSGVRVIYHLEWAFNGIEGLSTGGGFRNRLAYIGLTGDFGTVQIGRMNSPSKVLFQNGTVSDDSNSNWRSSVMTAAGDVFFGGMGSINTFNAGMPSRLGNTLMYISPTWGGFNFDAGIMLNEGDSSNPGLFDKRRGIDLWAVNLAYNHESGFYVKGGYITGDSSLSSKRAGVYGIHTGFHDQAWGVEAKFAQGSVKGDSTFGVGNFLSKSYWSDVRDSVYNINQSFKHKATGWDLAGYIAFGPDYFSKITAQVGQAKSDKKYREHVNSTYAFNNRKEQNRLTTWALGFEQKLSNRTRVWIDYENSSVRQKFDRVSVADFADNEYRSKKFKEDRVNVGIRHDF